MSNEVNSDIFKRCDSCDKLINKNAKICIHCKEYQGFKNKIKFFAKSYTIPFLLAIVSIGQLVVSHSSYTESKQKRIEAESVLKEAENILSKSSEISKITNKNSEISLKKSFEAINNIDGIKNDIENIKNDFKINIEMFNEDINKSKKYVESISKQINSQLAILSNRN